MKTCFVSMPYGVKTDPYTGMTINFDNIYHELIVPAVMQTQVTSFRIDDVIDITSMQKAIIESVIGSDIMIVDLTTQNPNVMYELGMRHMAQRGLTIMICSTGSRIPANISNFKVISYELDLNGNVTEQSKLSFQQLLKYSIDSNLELIVADSPVYLLFPDIKFIFPENLTASESKRQMSRKTQSRKPLVYKKSSSREESIENLKEIQSSALNDPGEVDPIEFINLLKKYRDISAWHDLVSLAESVPDYIKTSPEVQQLYALALNRLGEQQKAIDLMENLIRQTGGDAESYGILGRIYKDKYENSKDLDDTILAKTFLNLAIANYKAGFEKQPSDYYTGVNVVNLLAQSDDDTSKTELKTILPRVREALANNMADTKNPSYWDYATATELSCIAGEWMDAEKQADLALQQKPVAWMLETTIRNLRLLKPAMDNNEKTGLDKIISLLQQNIVPVGGLVMPNYNDSINALDKLYAEITSIKKQKENAISNGELSNLRRDDQQKFFDKQIADIELLKRAELEKLVTFPPHKATHFQELDNFKNFGEYDKSVFIMTKFPATQNLQPRDHELQKVIDSVTNAITQNGFIPRIALSKRFHSSLWDNVEMYLLGCKRGIAIVQDKYQPELNPNVTMEWGWMKGMNRDVLFLVENDFDKKRADILGLIEDQFSWADPDALIKPAIDAWLAK